MRRRVRGRKASAEAEDAVPEPTHRGPAGILLLLALLAAIAAVAYYAFLSLPPERAAMPPEVASPPPGGDPAREKALPPSGG
ncbi:MAG TPA: hypothetical protein VM490_23865 [Armatimonadaceae bacterium]|nr:hypothetical protein [Armatimonadaceae bacterium]